MFANRVESSNFDLHFRLFNVDVRVHPFFWLMTAFLGWPTLQSGWQYLLLWIICVFVSILVHELGHVLTGRYFGTNGQIWLYGFGGLALDCSGLWLRWQRVLVYLAGPLAGFGFYGVVATIYHAFGGEHADRFDVAALSMLSFVNLYWGALNLLPIFPLDGGQVSREFFTWILPRGGLRIALGISLIVSVAIAVFAYTQLNSQFMAIMFGLFAFQNFEQLQSMDRTYQ